MKDKKSLFFVVKTLEMLGAIEARQQFQLTNTVLVLRPDKADVMPIKMLIEKSGNWDTIINVSGKSSYGLSWVKLIKKFQKEEYEYVFTRAFSISSYFIHNLAYEKHFFLDDGHETLLISSEFKKNKNLTKRFSLFGFKDRTGFPYNLVSYMYKKNKIFIEKEISKVAFFSYYDLEQIAHQIYVKNEMLWLQNLLKSEETVIVDDRVFLVGTNVVNCNFLELEDYYTTLLKISRDQLGKKIIYIPHPRESENHLKMYADKLGFEIRKNKFNLEIDFLLNKQIPVHLIGTTSTALITMKLIYKENIQASFYNFEEEKLEKFRKPSILELYEYQKKYINYKELKY